MAIELSDGYRQHLYPADLASQGDHKRGDCIASKSMIARYQTHSITRYSTCRLPRASYNPASAEHLQGSHWDAYASRCGDFHRSIKPLKSAPHILGNDRRPPIMKLESLVVECGESQARTEKSVSCREMSCSVHSLDLEVYAHQSRCATL